MTRHAALAACLVSLSACHPAPPPPRVVVAVAPATVRVTRTEPFSDHERQIRLAAARNEYEPFQIVVRAERQVLRHVNATVSDLRSTATAHTISASQVRLFREYYLNVLQTTGDIDWMPRIEYPGPLLPAFDPYTDPARPYGLPFNHGRIGTVGTPYLRDRPSTASCFSCGLYTGTASRAYVLQIERGGDAGQATFRWSDSWRKGLDGRTKVKRWNGRHVPIPPLDDQQHTPPIALQDGIQVWFAAGLSPHFQAGQTFHFRVYDAMNEVLWGEVYVPPGTPAGTYRGLVTVTADEMDPVECPIQLEVWDFDLPREKSIATAYHGWMTPAFFAKAPDPDRMFEQLQHRHRIDTQRLHGHTTKWAWKLDQIDWSSFDRVAEAKLSGRDYPDGSPMKRFNLGMYTCGNERHWAKIAGGSISNVETYARAFATHLKSKGWFDRVYLYCRDEPGKADMHNIERDIRAFLRADPDWKGKFMLTSRPTPGSPLLDLVDIWCVKYNWPIAPEVNKHLRERGSKFWCYVANTPHSPNPTYHLDSMKGYEPRLLKWAAWRMGAEGFLYWATVLDQAYPNPWTTPMNNFGACGDGNFIYYGARNGEALNDNATPLPPIMGPLPGFRLKQIREGLEDWEYLIQCEALRGREYTDALAAEVYRRPAGAYGKYQSRRALDKAWTQDPTQIYRTRRKLAQAILQATGSETAPWPDTSD